MPEAATRSIDDRGLDRDAAEFHRILTDLIRVHQFRDRDSICCHGVSMTQSHALAALACGGRGDASRPAPWGEQPAAGPGAGPPSGTSRERIARAFRRSWTDFRKLAWPLVLAVVERVGGSRSRGDCARRYGTTPRSIGSAPTGDPPERSPWVFHHVHSMAKVTAGDRIQSLRASFNRAAEDAKLPPEFVQHDLRHRRVTTWLAEGQSPAIVQKVLGHADVRTTLGYSHLVRQDLRQLVQKDEEREKAKLKELAQ